MSEQFIWKWLENTPASSQIRDDAELWIGARGGDPWVMMTLQSHRVDGKLFLYWCGDRFFLFFIFFWSW